MSLWSVLHRLTAALVLTALLLTLFAAPVAAQVEPAPETNIGAVTITQEDVLAAVNSPTPNLANTTAYIVYTIMVIINSGLVGNVQTTTTPTTNEQVSTYPSSVAHAFERRGVLGATTYLTAEMYRNQPASAQVYVADLIQQSRFAPQPAYAQGIGFGSLNPILGTWKAFRDVAYYLLTIMFFVTGFLILIRQKISGNVAVTVQNALPRLFITLILITFSYAIAGLIVDLMFITLAFIVNLFSTQIFEPDGKFRLLYGIMEKTPRELAFDTNIFEFTFGYVFSGTETSAWNAASALSGLIWSVIEQIPVLEFIAGLPLVGSLLWGILQLIFVLIFGVALLIAMFRTFFALLMSYAGFIINVVLSPLILLTGAIPGKDPFINWIKNLVAGLAPFVVAVFMIFMSLALTGSNTQAGIGYVDENSNTVSGLRLPLIMSGSNFNSGSIIGVLGMGFMLLLPEAVKMTKTMVGAKGGIFDEYKDAAINNFKKGWEGDKMVPGLGFTKMPGASRILMGDSKSREMAKKESSAGLLGHRYGIGGSLLHGANVIRQGRRDAQNIQQVRDRTTPPDNTQRSIVNTRMQEVIAQSGSTTGPLPGNITPSVPAPSPSKPSTSPTSTPPSNPYIS